MSTERQVVQVPRLHLQRQPAGLRDSDARPHIGAEWYVSLVSTAVDAELEPGNDVVRAVERAQTLVFGGRGHRHVGLFLACHVDGPVADETLPEKAPVRARR